MKSKRSIVTITMLVLILLTSCVATVPEIEHTVTPTATSIITPTIDPTPTPYLEPIIICFDAGHFANYNRNGIKPDGTQYSEGEGMLELANELSTVIPNSIFSRPTYEDNPSYKERTEFAVNGHAEVLISLHTNWQPETYDIDKPGITVYYSVLQPENKENAIQLALYLSVLTGIKINRVTYWENSDTGTDYLAMIKRPVEAGINQVYLVEIGSHWQFAGDYENNINRVTKALFDFYHHLMYQKYGEIYLLESGIYIDETYDDKFGYLLDGID